MMRRLLLAALAVTTFSAPAHAIEPAEGAIIGTTPVEIGSALAGEGYDLHRFERDEGRIDVIAIKEDRRIEMSLDPSTGAVRHMETHERKGPWPVPGATMTEVMAALSAEGYEVMEFARAEDEIEVKALKDQMNWEIRINPATGAILAIEQEK